MPNSFFRFKQFTIHQHRTAMKVCTDSCLLGAWTAERINGAATVLDIGAGTGLLSLMLAQKSKARIECIETDHDAALQALENIAGSPWRGRVHLTEADVRTFEFKRRYDFVISNPPFYESDLHSPQEQKNKARHETSLSLEELIRALHSCLDPLGSFSILLPFHRSDYFENLALNNGFFLRERWIIRQTPKHDPFRSICLFSYEKQNTVIGQDMYIKDQSGKYSTEFKLLMNDFYE